MTDIITQISDAQTCREVDRIVEQNIDRMYKTQPFNVKWLLRFAGNAKRRILRLRREMNAYYNVN
jgi:hypothetical protein